MRLSKYLFLVCILLFATSCDKIAKRFSYAPVESSSSSELSSSTVSPSEGYNNSDNSKSTIVNEFDVEADVYKIVRDYSGKTFAKEIYKGRETIHSKVYSDGRAYSGSMPIFRAMGEATENYDFNCFNETKSYYFNTNNLD